MKSKRLNQYNLIWSFGDIEKEKTEKSISFASSKEAFSSYRRDAVLQLAATGFSSPEFASHSK